jgi:two-component system sensor histidine kinase ChvG
LLALLVLIGGVLWLDRYRDGLIDAKIRALQTQAEIIAGALGESAVEGPAENVRLSPELARSIVRRLAAPAQSRSRLFATGGELVADSRQLESAGRHVQLKYLPPPGSERRIEAALARLYDWIMPRLPRRERFPLYFERPHQVASDYPEVTRALGGAPAASVRSLEEGGLIVAVAVPVQYFRQVLGALLLTADSADIEESVRAVRVAILEVSGLALVVTVLMSVFLAGTIARPVRRLASAARSVRRWGAERVRIPDFSRRHDEIGDLSVALGQMTEAFYARLEAIEGFAADVAHEIKNPLTSLRSAVEAAAVARDPAQRAQLMQVIRADVGRLDRLVTDISNASRLDAELAREESELVDLAELLHTVIEIYRSRVRPDDAPVLRLDMPPYGDFLVRGAPGRLGQVLDNLLSNAISFSPPQGVVRVALGRREGMFEIRVEDEGPGVPEEHAERLFERFYTRRPEGEAFGRHSGLGLSIARQIVEAHGGTIQAGNRRDAGGEILGARFLVRLPSAGLD